MSVQPGFEGCTSLEEQDGRIAAMPILVLNIHSRCNCRCVMCDIWKREQSNEVNAAQLEKDSESLRRLGVEWVVLTGGEPLMNRELSSVCAFFRERGIRLTLLTSGLLLERRAAEVATCVDDIIVSLDGPREIHDAIRRVKGGFDLIQSGVGAMRRLRPEMRMMARTTVQKLNHTQLRQTAIRAQALGLNGISFLAADLTSEAFNRTLVWPAEVQGGMGLLAAEADALEREIEELIVWSTNDCNRGFVAEGPAKLRKLTLHFRAYLGQVDFEAPRCNAPWVSSVVEADGTVRPCFFHRPIGSLRQASLEEVVNGEAALAFRRKLDVANDPVCRKCVCSLYHRSLA
jgi:MoaA/NifB/PqqE/SkfB family radical SAM enzyme